MEDTTGDQGNPKGNSQESDQPGDVHADNQEHDHDVDKTLYVCSCYNCQLITCVCVEILCTLYIV